ncbi:MAG: lytic transglycosylase domain-containing protein [Steroidobacteraceae bacterium]
MLQLISCAQNSSADGARVARLGAVLLAVLWLGPVPAHADQQRDPELRVVIERAISQAECFADKYESAVWYKLMEPRLRRLVSDREERLEILKHVFCESRRDGETRLPPGLLMAVIDVESRFNRWAVSAVGAQGLMQVMPFWPAQLGMRRYELVHVAPNIRMGTAILRFYLKREHNDVRKALARYNGSAGRRDYPDRVLYSWSHWNGADDLGLGHPVASQMTAKP